MVESQPESGREIEVEINEFGNSAHAILPKELAGESAIVSTQSDIDRWLTAPVSISDLRNVLQSMSISDLRSADGDVFALEGDGVYTYTEDTRLRIEINVVREYPACRFLAIESGSVLFSHEPKIEHIEPYVDDDDVLQSIDNDRPEVIWRDDDLAGIIEGTDNITIHWIRNCELYWNGDLIEEFEFTHRDTACGDILVPLFDKTDSLEEFMDSFKYDIATLLSETPVDAFDTYFEVLADEFMSESSSEPRVVGPDEEHPNFETISMEEVATDASIIQVDGKYI